MIEAILIEAILYEAILIEAILYKIPKNLNIPLLLLHIDLATFKFLIVPIILLVFKLLLVPVFYDRIVFIKMYSQI